MTRLVVAAVDPISTLVAQMAATEVEHARESQEGAEATYRATRLRVLGIAATAALVWLAISLLLIRKSNKTATYDWGSGQARWSGDVKADRSGPITLQAGDMDAMLINLAIARDVQAGKPLVYRMVDDGRAKQMSYQVAGKESITIGGKAQQATKVSRTDGDRETVVWVVDGLPVPARILQRKNGSDEMDLQLKSFR